MSDKGLGQSVKRKEDFRFITGKGNYTDDIVLPHQLYAYFLRSPVAHAKLKSINMLKNIQKFLYGLDILWVKSYISIRLEKCS